MQQPLRHTGTTTAVVSTPWVVSLCECALAVKHYSGSGVCGFHYRAAFLFLTYSVSLGATFRQVQTRLLLRWQASLLRS